MLTLALAMTVPGLADERATQPLPYVIAPVTTELQRALLDADDRNVKVAVLIDGKRIADVAKLDGAALDVNAIDLALRRWPGRENGAADVHVFGTDDDAKMPALWCALYAITGVARSAGFADASGMIVSHDDGNAIAALQKTPPAADELDEPATGSGPVHAYPVRTRLSRVLMAHGSGEADLFVDVRLDEQDEPDADERVVELREAIHASAASITVERHDVIAFRVTVFCGSAGTHIAERLCEQRDAIAKELGFTKVRWSTAHKPSSSTAPPAPRADGSLAPDFRLRSVTGDEVTLSSLRGRVVLLNFWGFRCGWCRVEAPHLARLYEQYRERGFTVLGIEMGDTPREQVASYASEHKLGYPMLLDGGELARQYQVTAQPTSIWIDRSGRIVERHDGFLPEDLPALISTLRRLIAQP